MRHPRKSWFSSLLSFLSTHKQWFGVPLDVIIVVSIPVLAFFWLSYVASNTNVLSSLNYQGIQLLEIGAVDAAQDILFGFLLQVFGSLLVIWLLGALLIGLLSYGKWLLSLDTSFDWRVCLQYVGFTYGFGFMLFALFVFLMVRYQIQGVVLGLVAYLVAAHCLLPLKKAIMTKKPVMKKPVFKQSCKRSALERSGMVLFVGVVLGGIFTAISPYLAAYVAVFFYGISGVYVRSRS